MKEGNWMEMEMERRNEEWWWGLKGDRGSKERGSKCGCLAMRRAYQG